MVSVASSLDGCLTYTDDDYTTYLREALCSASQEEKDTVYNELWHACAGPQVNIPNIGEKVFYFPQGHLEQVEAFTNQEPSPELPVYDLPSMIPCTVIYVQRKAEMETDEVFVQVTLLPDTEKMKEVLPSGFFPSLPQRTKNMTQNPPAQELVAKDLHGFEWRFRHIYRGAPRRHLLSSGWSTFVSAKKIAAGDTFIFLRGENEDYRVGVRHCKNLHNNTASVLTTHSMQLGVLATAFHALTAGSMFTVYYRPRSSPTNFIVPCDLYTKSIKTSISVGMVFRLKSDDDECPEESLIGTIAGIEEVDPAQWSGPCAVVRPERISPWKIEALEVTNKSPISFPNLSKRPRTPRYMSSALVNHGKMSLRDLIEPAPQTQRHQEVLQDQEDVEIGNPESGNEEELSLEQWLPSSSSGSSQTRRRKLDYKILHPSSLYSNNMAPSSNGNQNCMVLAGCFLPAFSGYLTNGDIGQNGNGPIPLASLNNSGIQESESPRPNEVVDTSLSMVQPYDNATCMLFGVDLSKNSTETVSDPTISSTKNDHTCKIVPSQLSESTILESDHLSKSTKPSNSSGSGSGSVKPCQNCAITTLSCIKVHKYGIAIGRTVDVMKFNGYDELATELDHMFDFKGALMKQNSDWCVVYTDEEGDTMLVGDSPWMEFRSMVRKLLVCPKEHIDTL
ncbi:hypothetical protein IFM89_037762 [Coptis chinensis]|uniref:Auxin response factor n=1 Tax=Coptis chinensis TaxID=261450 RepID=A0A835IT41_9MAGN|nr:hypothetical protein IFM89_037762 [Coptis chinensis]